MIMDNTETGSVETEVKETEVALTEENTEAAPKGKSYPTQAVLAIRAIVGGYVMYLAYQIVTSGNEITPLMWAAVALFVIAGVVLVVMSVKHFICGEYEGGKRDTE